MLLSITDIIKQTLTLYRTNMALILRYVVLLFIPSACSIILGLILLILVPETMHIGSMGTSFLIYVILSIIISLISFWFSMTLIRVLSKRYDGTAVDSMSAEVQNAKHIVWPALGVTILTGLAVFGGTLLLIIPGVIFAIWFAFAIYGVAIHNTRPVDAMRASKALVDGRWWAVLWRLVIPAILFAVIMVIIQYIIDIPLTYTLQHTDPDSLLFMTWSLISGLISSLITYVMLPLTTAIPIIVYTDLKKNPLVKQMPPTEQVPQS